MTSAAADAAGATYYLLLQQAAQHLLTLLVSVSQNLFKCYCYCNSCVAMSELMALNALICTFKVCAKYHSEANDLCS